MSKIIFSIAFAFFLQDSFGQPRNNELSFMVKLTLFREAVGNNKYVPNMNALKEFIKLDFGIDTLTSTGFLGFTFVSINPKFKNPENIDLTDLPILVGNCEKFIAAYDGKEVYRLKGFVTNDFPLLIHKLKILGYGGTNSYQKFIENYYVKELDIGCLYLAFKRNKKIDKEKYQCLLTCSEVVFIE